MKVRLGIDLGGTAIKAGIVDEEQRILSRGSAPSNPMGRSFEDVVDDIAKLGEQTAAQADLQLSDLDCAGIGTPGCVNPRTGMLVFTGNMDWRNVALRDELQRRLGVPTHIGNDANCAIIGETLAGAAKGRKNVLLLTLGTGLGGGLILDGKLYVGGDGMGAELGHTPFVFGGEPCTCGVRGCYEAYASVSGLIRITREAMEAHPESYLHEWAEKNGGRITGRTAFDCMRQGDETARAVVDQYTTYVAAGIAGFINVYRPEVVLIGGGISHEGDYLMRPINEKLPGYVFAGDILPVPPVIVATLENDAGIIGAANLDRM